MSAPGTLQSISIQGLRSYASLDASFGGGPQLIVGPNAAGKTTLLEAIVLLAWGRSHRTSTDGELVRWGQELARIEG
ncbi:MAG: replication and repair protein RecF, partial [Chloroflexota bacterium]|nr:replication and repair protein RecF [Chloroflexota bacterium]